MDVFREMRRFRQRLTDAECKDILGRMTSGVLAVAGDGGYPYAVPLSYVYHNGRIFFHSAMEGHKIDAIRKCDRVSFCVIEQDMIVPGEYTTYFRSVIAFGRARILDDAVERRDAMALLAMKYSPEQAPMRIPQLASDAEFARTCMVEMRIEHLSGKEAIELARMRRC